MKKRLRKYIQKRKQERFISSLVKQYGLKGSIIIPISYIPDLEKISQEEGHKILRSIVNYTSTPDIDYSQWPPKPTLIQTLALPKSNSPQTPPQA